MKIKCLIDNSTQRPDFWAEHGLSLYIEACGKKILFDTGASEAFEDNAVRFGVDLREIDFCVLSHGHYAHANVLLKFMEENETAPVYMNEHAFEPHVAKGGKDIGLKKELMGNSRIILAGDYLKIADGLELYSCNDKERTHAVLYGGLDVIKDGVQVPDDFIHEQYLMITEGFRKILISGCSHKGILNIMEWLQPDILVGGFHFMGVESDGLGSDMLKASAEELLSYNTVYYTGHCTGLEQYCFMKQIMCDKVHYLAAGQVLEI